MRIVVTGGAGYIGSHMVKMLLGSGHEVLVLDNFSTGFREAVLGGKIIYGELGDSAAWKEVFSTGTVDAVMHFASFSQVGESVQDPTLYYRNNVADTLTMLEEMNRHGVKKLIFSSSAAVFGEPRYLPIDEQHPCLPLSPYGHSKLMVEQILKDCSLANGLESVSLRYFNAAGADPETQTGECHNPETHLIPLALRAAREGTSGIAIFGNDYDTPDGTCIRDYVHVWDLCDAHLRALHWLVEGRGSAVFNLGNGTGFSVRQVIDMVRDVTGMDVAVTYGSRREGDPASLVADSSRARERLGWAPGFSELKTIISDAWAWECKCAANDSQRFTNSEKIIATTKTVSPRQ